MAFKNVSKPGVKFCRVWRKNTILGKIFSIFEENAKEKLNFIYFGGNMLLKIDHSEITSFFSTRILSGWVGGFEPPPQTPPPQTPTPNPSAYVTEWVHMTTYTQIWLLNSETIVMLAPKLIWFYLSFSGYTIIQINTYILIWVYSLWAMR